MSTEKILFEDDERVLAEVRAHWFVMTIRICSILIVALGVGVLFRLFIDSALFTLPDIAIDGGIFLYLIFLLFMWMSIFSIWTNYYLDVWTITTKRLIIVDQRGLFSRRTGSFRLERLQDVNVSISGILATLLGYGTIETQTASSDESFRMRYVPNPEAMKALILRAADTTTYARGAPPDTVDTHS